MIIIKDKISKQEIAAMPHVLFNGKIITIDTLEQVDDAVNDLRQHPLLGIDSETRPTFRKGEMNKVALLQISTDDDCYLFRLNKIGIPSAIVSLLEDEKIMKIGLSLKDDLLSLNRRQILHPQNWMDLQNVVKFFGIKDQSLQKIYANLFGQKISKGQRLTNWEAVDLSEGQKRYACTDAWTCLKIYRFLQQLKETNGYQVQKVIEESTETKEELDI
jgi:ribonuclease D